MKALKIIFKIFVVCALLIAILFAGIALYMKFYGKGLLEDALSSMVGAKIKFAAVSLNLGAGAASFRNFSIVSEIDFGKDVFNAEKFTVSLNQEKFKAEKKVVFEEVRIEKAVFNIVRNRQGVLNLSFKKPSARGLARRFAAWRGTAIAYADEPAGMAFYDFAKNVRAFVIQDSVINFNDEFIRRAPLAIKCDKLNLILRCGPDPIEPAGYIPAHGTISFRIPSEKYKNGEFLLKANMAAHKDRLDMDTDIDTKFIDVMQFLPYFERHTPFTFKEGVFSSHTDFEMHNNYIDSLTTMTFHRLDLSVDPGAENADFLNTSVNRLAPYLASGSGEIVFDFVVTGPADNPSVGIGPKVKFAIGMVAVEEAVKALQQMQQAR